MEQGREDRDRIGGGERERELASPVHHIAREGAERQRDRRTERQMDGRTGGREGGNLGQRMEAGLHNPAESSCHGNATVLELSLAVRGHLSGSTAHPIAHPHAQSERGTQEKGEREIGMLIGAGRPVPARESFPG